MSRPDGDRRSAGNGLAGGAVFWRLGPETEAANVKDEGWTEFRARNENWVAWILLAVVTGAISFMVLLVIGFSTPVPAPVVRFCVISVPYLVVLFWIERKPIQALRWAWRLTVIAGLAGITGIALWLGFQDLVWAVSLPAQILGGFFLLSGIATFIGVLLIVGRLLPFAPKWVCGAAASAWIAAAAASGIYVSLTIVAHSFRYEPAKAWLFTLLAAGCLILAIRTLPAAWQGIGNFVKGAGITLALLGSAANFWFQSIYLPENAQAGIQYGLSVDSVVASGSGRVAALDFTMQNQSPVTAITIGTMLTVSELLFPANSGLVSNAVAQQNADNYARNLFEPANPDIGLKSALKPVILTVIEPVPNGNNLPPNDTVSRQFDVVIPPIPKGEVVALQVEWHVLYARSSRLTLGTYKGSHLYLSRTYCRAEEVSGWTINQSALVRFTRGAQILSTRWCADLSDPAIDWTVRAARGPSETPRAREGVMLDLGVSHSNRTEIFVLPGT